MGKQTFSMILSCYNAILTCFVPRSTTNAVPNQFSRINGETRRQKFAFRNRVTDSIMFAIINYSFEKATEKRCVNLSDGVTDVRRSIAKRIHEFLIMQRDVKIGFHFVVDLIEGVWSKFK